MSYDLESHFGFDPAPKPPIGIMPPDIWIDHRVKELAGAIQRYAEFDARHESIAKWAQEIVDLRKEKA